jgi:hypothetical protein
LIDSETKPFELGKLQGVRKLRRVLRVKN